jgi:methyl coenzyme M reductase subunit C-like uncharacterized protein (methanogenesis marker protein 7)
MNETISFLNSISEDRLLIILEGFRVALNDADTYDDIVEQMDISDNELFELREIVCNFMNVA